MRKLSTYFILLLAVLFISCTTKSVLKDGGIVVEIEKNGIQYESDSVLIDILQKRLNDFYPKSNPYVYFDKNENLINAEVPEITENLFDSTIITSHGKFEISEVLELSLIFDGLAKDSIMFSNNDTLQCVFNDLLLSPNQLLIKSQDTCKLNSFFANERIKSILKDIKYSICYGRLAELDNETLFFMFLDESNNKFDLDKKVQSIKIEKNTRNNHQYISIWLKPEYAKLWEDLTRKNIGYQLAILLDNRLITAPKVVSVIEGGVLSISGDYSTEELLKIFSLLNNGKIESDIKIKSITQH